jgi:acylphosphatase
MSTEKPQAASITVTGRVQRVGYIRNMDDGSVKIFCQAPPTILRQLIEKAKNPPPPAQIKQFEIKEDKPRPKLKIFKIRYGLIQQELQEGFGAMQSISMDYWREFKDYRSEFRDFREEFRSFVSEFRGYREEFREFAKRTDENFKAIMEKYGEISEKLTTILETLTRESRETREMLNETMKLLKEALERLSR